MKREKTKVEFSSKGPEGNIYYILRKVADAMKKESRIIEYNDLRDEVFNCESYADAIAKIREHIDLIDKDNRVWK